MGHDHEAKVAAFGVCPTCETLLGVPSAPSGDELAAEGIARAEAAASDEWIEQARAVVADLAHTGEPFTSDDIWARLPSPPEPRALGAVMRWATQFGFVVDSGRSRQSTRPENHSRQVTIWVPNG